MTKQESIFEVAKTLYLVDKTACYNQLSKIDFSEIVIVFGKDSELELDIKNLVLFLAITENIKNTINIPDEIMRMFGAQVTPMFNDPKSMATYLFNDAVSKNLIDKNSLNLSKTDKVQVPNIEARLSFENITDSKDVIKDDIVKLLDLFKTDMLSLDRLEAFELDGNSDKVLYELKINFSVKRNMFDYGLKNINLLLGTSLSSVQPILSFLQNFVPLRGLSDESVQEIISSTRQNVLNTKNEMLLDKTLIMLEYQSSTVTTLKTSTILQDLKTSITRYKNLGINIQVLRDLLELKGLQ